MMNRKPHEPVRKIRPNRRSRTGIYPSRKAGNIAFESELEEHGILCLDFEPWVISMAEQPFKIDLYTPDLEILTAQYGTLIADIAYESELVQDWDRSCSELKRKNEYCNENGMIYGLIPDSLIHRNRVTALSLVHQLSRSNWFDHINQSRNHIKKESGFLSPLDDYGMSAQPLEIAVVNLLAEKGPLSVASVTSQLVQSRINCEAEDVFMTLTTGNVYLADTPSLDHSSWILDSAYSTQAQSIKFFMKYEQFIERIMAHPDMHRQKGSPIIAIKER